MVPYYMDTRSNSRANTCVNPGSNVPEYLLDTLNMDKRDQLEKQPFRGTLCNQSLVSHNNCVGPHHTALTSGGGSSFKFLPYQLSKVV